MREDDKNLWRETGRAFALAACLSNVLILLVLSGSVWAIHSLIARADALGLFLRDQAIYR